MGQCDVFHSVRFLGTVKTQDIGVWIPNVEEPGRQYCFRFGILSVAVVGLITQTKPCSQQCKACRAFSFE
jgi:hypothetical protein